jgi:hypothetical protein
LANFGPVFGLVFGPKSCWQKLKRVAAFFRAFKPHGFGIFVLFCHFGYSLAIFDHHPIFLLKIQFMS